MHASLLLLFSKKRELLLLLFQAQPPSIFLQLFYASNGLRFKGQGNSLVRCLELSSFKQLLN